MYLFQYQLIFLGLFQLIEFRHQNLFVHDIIILLSTAALFANSAPLTLAHSFRVEKISVSAVTNY